MIIGMITGMTMLHLRLFHLADLWMQVKLVGVILLVAFHVKCHLLFIQAVKTKEDSKHNSPNSWGQLVAIGATLGVFFLFLMGLKDSFQWVSGTVIATSVTALIGFWLAKKT
jgi:putative membrane protein